MNLSMYLIRQVAFRAPVSKLGAPTTFPPQRRTSRNAVRACSMAFSQNDKFSSERKTQRLQNPLSKEYTFNYNRNPNML